LAEQRIRRIADVAVNDGYEIRGDKGSKIGKFIYEGAGRGVGWKNATVGCTATGFGTGPSNAQD